MKLSDFLDVAATLADLWPGSNITKGTLEAWYPLLADLDVDVIHHAINALRLDPAQRFAPGPGEIRTIVADATGMAARDWLDAWQDLAAAIATANDDPCPRLDDVVEDPLVTRWILANGGRSTLAARFSGADTTARAQFRDWYRDQQRRHATRTRNAIAARAIAGELTQGGAPPAAIEGGR